ncbi:MAG: tetratricopeptide repeat protein [Chloroflexota bacterium]|jgi:DNA-binding SARP family transcriptional activator/predicted ATPase/Tfp pilus assembly protein PilF
MLKLTLLGHPGLYLDGNEIRIVSRKAAALLFYLAVNQRPYSRTSLAGLFWGDVPESSARRSLRVALTKLRGAIGEYVVADRTTVRFNHELNHQLDIIQVQDALAGPPAGIRAARLAAANLRGEFLEDFHIDGAPEFENWQLTQRERLDRAARALLTALVEHDHQAAELEQALDYARRLLAMDPWREQSQRWVMRLLAELGRTAAALAQYERCRELLAQELGVEPAVETRRLAQAIRAGKIQPVADEPAAGPAPVAAAARPVAHNLPLAGATFVGRAGELAQIEELLGGPECRLLTILGPGGVGKSRLALEAARRWIKSAGGPFPDGIYFVPLAAAGPDDDLAQSVAANLELNLGGEQSPESQLLVHLAGRRVLLILDNFERLVGRADWLLSLLNGAPGLRLLVTSQERLPLLEAWNLDLSGLPTPPEDQPGQPEEYDAVGLFVERARRMALNFDYQAEAAGVARICRLVDGLPLAIELAAAWVRGLSCRQIADRISADLAQLQMTSPSLPPRQQSLEAVFANSWSLLTREEQAIYPRLSTFRGGFAAAAAEKVATAGQRALLSLADKSLVRRQPDGRYQMHEMLRQLAGRRLAEDETNLLAQSHAAYFANFLQQRGDFWHRADAPAVLDEIAAELDNVRLAWDWAVAEAQHPLLRAAMSVLRHFYDMRGYFAEGLARFGRAAGCFPDGSPIQAQLAYRQASFAFRLGQNETARDLAAAAIPLLESAGHRHDAAGCLLVLGNAVRDMGDHPAARDAFGRSAALYEDLDDSLGLAAASNNLGVVLYYEDDMPGATACFLAALEAREQAGVEDIMTELGNVGLCYSEMGDYAAAVEYLGRSLDLARKFDAPLAIGLAHHNLGNAYRNDSQAPLAVHHLQDGVEIFRELGSRDALAAALADLAAAYRQVGRFDDAEAALLEGLELEEALARPRGVAFKHMGLGDLYLAQDQDRRAREHYRQVLAMGEAEAGVTPVLNALLGAAVIQARAGDTDLLAQVLAAVQAHPNANHETRTNAEHWAAALEVDITLIRKDVTEDLDALARRLAA